MKDPEPSLVLRHAQADHLLDALNALPDDKKRSIIHTDLVKRILMARDIWKKHEAERRAKVQQIIKTKSTYTKKVKADGKNPNRRNSK